MMYPLQRLMRWSNAIRHLSTAVILSVLTLGTPASGAHVAYASQSQADTAAWDFPAKSTSWRITELLDSTPGQGQPLRVLFLGNSLTYWNNTPQIFKAITAQGTGRPVVVGLLSGPGWSVKELWEKNNGKAMQAIQRVPWDYVVFQSRENPTTPEVREILDQFRQAVTARGARTVVYFIGYTAEEQARRADSMGVINAPIQAAFAKASAEIGSNLCDGVQGKSIPGNCHPAPAGSYLQALVLYRAITGRSPIGLSAPAITPSAQGAWAPGPVILKPSEIEILQRAAAGGVPSAP